MDHAPDAHAPHSHGHAHDHNHDHHHDHGQGEYYLQQLLTVFICGAFGVAGILMYTLGKLQYILAPGFHIWVLVGSLLLLFMTAVRGVALWQSAGQKQEHDHHHDHNHDHAGGDCGHDHKHGEACAHGHHHHAHSDHTAADHDHGNIYWRVVVLAFPVAILAMGLPNGSFSNDRLMRMLGNAEAVTVQDVAEKGDGTITSDFDLLATIAFDPAKREAYTGTTASITGQMEKLTDKQFRLYKMKMTCCSADMIPLQARAIVKNASQMGTFGNGDMIEVRGVIQFVQDSKSGDYLTVLKVDPNDGIRPTK